MANHNTRRMPRNLRYPTARFLASAFAMAVQSLALVAVFEVLMAMMVWLPDIDHALSPFLHHRSIVTHSILIPGLLGLLFYRFRLASAFCALFLAATAVHLLADALSPSTGFGAVWLPPGANIGLAGLSPWWLGINGLLCAISSIWLMHDSWRTEFLAALLACAAIYGLANEQSPVSAGFIVCSLLLCAGVARALGWFTKTPKTKLKLLEEQRDKRVHQANVHSEAMALDMVQARLAQELAIVEAEAAWAKRGRLGRTLVRILFVPRLLWHTVRRCLAGVQWALRNPKRVLGSATAIFITVASLYFIGLSAPDAGNEVGSATSGGASAVVASSTKAVADGLWVLHSSGGYILTNGGKYVAGTLRPTVP